MEVVCDKCGVIQESWRDTFDWCVAHTCIRAKSLIFLFWVCCHFVIASGQLFCFPAIFLGGVTTLLS